MDFNVLLFFFVTMCLVRTNQDTAKQNSITHTELRDEHKSSSHNKWQSVNSDPTNLRLAAFNVRTFGTKKMATPGVPGILVKIILRYDVILIQEIRDLSGAAIRRLLSLVNKQSTRGQYKITISPRLGRTSSKEQYAFLYRKDVLFVKHSYVYEDGKEELHNDTFEREPYIVHFNSTQTDPTDFVLVAIHTSPSKANQEIHALAPVYDDVIRQLGITNVIILGDLNAACSYMRDSDWQTNRLANDKRFHWLISDCVDTTVTGGHCAYDRFVVAGDAMLAAVTKSSAGSYKFDDDLNVARAMAVLVSDHYPVEMQLYSKELATAMRHISQTVEYIFKMKQYSSLTRRTVFDMGRRAIKDGELRVHRTYRRTGAISSVTFTKDFGNLQQALNVIHFIRDRTDMIKVNMISAEQTQNVEFHLEGAWAKEKRLLAKKTGSVKIVCEMFPRTSCWIALVFK